MVRRFAVDFLRNSLLLLCLFAPSAWMIATIPPLWRDADAYVQVTQKPLVATFWGHAPAYCYIAKVPLFLGEQIERLRGNTAAGSPERSQPALTDSGFWLLIVGQHLGLGIAVFSFIRAVTNIFGVRLALAIIWASNALFYTFAHCVGSETLGMILIVVLALKALRLIQKSEEAGWTDWYVFAVVLVLCILSRDLNLALVALLPAAFLISSALRMIAKQGRRSLATAHFRQAVIAIAIGMACVAVAHSIPQGLARKTRLHPHSRIGYTFLWRLHFLSNLPADSRTAVLQKVSARTQSNHVRKLIALLEQMLVEKADLSNPTPLLERAIPFFGGSLYWENLDRALNQMAFAFLWPPSPELRHAIRTDAAMGVRQPSTLISEYLFATTAYYFQHQAEMPACANLVTFRGEINADKISQLPFQYRYFHLWRGLTWSWALLLWLGSGLVFLVVARRQLTSASAIMGLAIGLTLLGFLIFAITCVLHDYEPRFSLSMWELLVFSFFLLAGATANLLALGSPPGSHCCPEP
jgi:hypothetical protein